jgi:hypothetical protein
LTCHDGPRKSDTSSRCGAKRQSVQRCHLLDSN